MIHFSDSSPLAGVEAGQFAFLDVEIFGHFFKVVGNFVVYIIFSKRIEICAAASFFIFFLYKLMGHLVVLVAVFAVRVVGGHLGPVFVIQDGGDVCFHVFFPEGPGAPAFPDFVRIGEN